MTGFPNKLLYVLALLGKEEATYNTPVSLSGATDGLQLQYKDKFQGAPVELAYAFDGTIGPSVSVLGPNIRVGQSGRSAKGSLPFRFRGAGVAYSSSIVPSFHRFLKMCGLDATGSFGAGLEKWTYAPTPLANNMTSLTLNAYTKGELWALAGAMASLKFDAPDAAPPLWTADFQSTASALPTDVPIGSIPAITYPLQTVPPPLATSVTLTFGSFTTNAVLLSSSFDQQRQLTARVAQSASGAHLGFVGGDFAPQVKLVLESTNLVTTPFTSASGFDPYNLLESGQQFVFAIRYGGVQYDRVTLNMPQAQLVAYTNQNNGPVATTELTLAGANSTAALMDCFNIVAD